MKGLMQETPLLISSLVEHAACCHGETAIVSRGMDGRIHRTNYAGVAKRAKKLANALQALGIRFGDRVASLAWNSHRHLELYYGVPSCGAVLNTVNPRLFHEQITYIVSQAGNRCVFFDPHLMPLVESIAADLPSVEAWIVLTDEAGMPPTSLANVLCYEALLRDQPDTFEWSVFDENTASVICYTSGTTGNPKGVVYSHRSTVLQAFSGSSVDSFCSVSYRDRILIVVPMFRANAWGLPYASAMTGAGLVLPGPQLDPSSLTLLLNGERVTMTGGVATVWLNYLQHLENNPQDRPTHLKRIFVGAGALPPALMERMEERFGIEMIGAWGMTEASPLVGIANLLPKHEGLSLKETRSIRVKSGRTVYGVEIDIVDDEGRSVPRDGKSPGAVRIRGPWIVSGYFGLDQPAVDQDNWFLTGDIGTIDPDGYLQLTDRSKDVIKSGGEWISSIDIENETIGHPDVLEAAVIGIHHPRWQERPLLVVTAKPGVALTREAILDHLKPRIASWWMPDDVVILDELPHTGTGKISKVELRKSFAGYQLPDREKPAGTAARS